MANSKWTNSNVEGRGLRLAFNKLLGKLKEETDSDKLVKIANAMAYVADKKVSISHRVDLEDRVKELEEIAGVRSNDLTK